MSLEELEKMYEPYTVEGYTGIEFWCDEEYNLRVSALLDGIIDIYPDFKIYQLKLKFGQVRFYTNLPQVLEWVFESYISDEYKRYKERCEKENIEQKGTECD